MASRVERILIVGKTYPSPSAQHVETSCVAGINADGVMRRLYPVPFRLIEEGQKFKKWQWVDVRIEKANKDHRPESHKLYVDTISCGEVLESKREWSARWEWLDRIPSFNSLGAVDAARMRDGLSLALLRPKQVISLDITKARNAEWTEEEKEKLIREQMQGELFDATQAWEQIRTLRKVPFDFHYRCSFETPDGDKEQLLKIVDWEAGALFWNCGRDHGDNWEAPFRAKLEGLLASKDLMFLIGNQHRFRDQWLIVSLIYPPKRKPTEALQGALF